MSTFSSFGSGQVPSAEPEPEPSAAQGRRESMVNGRFVGAAQPSPTLALPTGGEVEEHWKKKVEETIKAAIAGVTTEFADVSLMKLLADQDGIDIGVSNTSKLQEFDIPAQFAHQVIGKFSNGVYRQLATEIATEITAKNEMIKELTAKLATATASETALSDDAISLLERSAMDESKDRYHKVMDDLQTAWVRNQHSISILSTLTDKLMLYEYRENMEMPIQGCGQNQSKRQALREKMETAGCSITIQDTGIDGITKEIANLNKRIDAAEKSNSRFDNQMRILLSGTGLSPEVKDIAMSKVSFSPDDSCFVRDKPDPQLGRMWQRDVIAIMNQCPAKFWCIAPTIQRNFDCQHYTGVGWRPKGLDKNYAHISTEYPELKSVYAKQSSDLYSLLKKHIEIHVTTSTTTPIVNNLFIGNTTDEGDTTWKSRAVELDGVGVVEYWAHFHESNGKLMRETLKTFFEKTAEIELNSTTNLKSAFDHIEKQFATVRSYGIPQSFRVSHTKSLSKMCLALSGRHGAFSTVCTKFMKPATVEDEQFCFMTMQDFVSEATAILITLSESDVTTPTATHRALYSATKNDASYPLFSGHTAPRGKGGGSKSGGDSGGKGGGGKSHNHKKPGAFTCSGCDSNGTPCNGRIEPQVVKSLSGQNNKQHSALCKECFGILRMEKRLLVRSKDSTKAPWVRTWQEQKDGMNNHKHGKNNNDRKVARAYFCAHFSDIDKSLLSDLPPDDDEGSVQSGFSAMSDGEMNELKAFRAQRQAMTDQKAMAATAATTGPTNIELQQTVNKMLAAMTVMAAKTGSSTGGGSPPNLDNNAMIASLSEMMMLDDK